MHTHGHTHTLCLPLIYIVTHTLSPTISVCLCLSHTHTHSLTAIFISISMDVLNGCGLCPLLCVCACLCVFMCADCPVVKPRWSCVGCVEASGGNWKRGGGRLRTQFPSAVECLHACSCLERLLTAPRSWQETTRCLHWGR